MNTLPAGLSWLVLDASGPIARTGLWKSGRWLAYAEDASHAAHAIFAGVRNTLADANARWENVGGFVYVKGPGSVLGMRVAAMAIRAWQADDAATRPGSVRPVWACGSLNVAGAMVFADGQKTPFAVCTEARQGFWHVLEIGDENAISGGSSVELTDAELKARTVALYHVPSRKAWRAPPAGTFTVKHSLRAHPETFARIGLCREVAQPVPFAGQEATYREWNEPAASEPGIK